MLKWIIGSVLILFTLVVVPLNHGQQKPMGSAELYDIALELYNQGKYTESIASFSRLIQTFPDSKSVPYSVHMMGQCYLRIGKLEEAIQQFELYLRTYADGDRRKEVEKGIQAAQDGLKARAASASPQTAFTAPSPAATKTVRRRICAQVFFFNAQTLDEVERNIKDLKKAGIDTLILRVFQTKGDRMYPFASPRYEEGVYFRTEYAPMVDDLLGKMTEIAHRNGLDIFAWMTTRYADYGIDENSELRCVRYNFETKRMEPSRGFSLFHPEVLKRLQGLFRDLGRYPIDGILFQDDLILRHNEDFHPEALKAFLKEFGYAPHPDLFYIDPYRSESGKYYVKVYTDRFWSWVNWKNRWLMNVTQQLMLAARESNPDLQFGINLYYEAVLNHSNGVAWFSQNLSEALKKDFDYYAVMAYHRQTMRELNMDEQRTIRLMAEVAQKAVQSTGDPARVMMKLQILDWQSNEMLPVKEMDEILTAILDQGNVSLAFVPYVESFPFHLLKGRWIPVSPNNRKE